MYSKEVTGWINECWARGASAEATVKAIQQAHGIKLGLATVYRHRHNLTTKDLVDELLRQQETDISHCDEAELKLKYRNELLKIFIPQMTINLNKNVNETTINRNVTLEGLPEEDKIAVLDAYRRLHRQDGGAFKPSNLH